MNNDNLPILTQPAYEYFKEPHTCSLCGQMFEGWGRNPEPLKPYNRRCCNQCNNTLVLPWRLRYGSGALPSYLHCGYGKSLPSKLDYSPRATQNANVRTINKIVPVVDPASGRAELPVHLDTNRVWYGRRPDEDDQVAQAVHDALSKGSLNGRHNTGVITQ